MSDTQHVGHVREIFSTITRNYDFLNHLLSLGQDIAWRNYTARKMRFFATHRLLDVATGTGDLALEAARRHAQLRVAGLDFALAMMDVAARKICKKGFSDRIHLIHGNALALPFPDNSFDVASIAFGIRNIAEKGDVLREMTRVVVPGGQVLVLEMTAPPHRLLRRCYGYYLRYLLPAVARHFSRNPAAYHYLADSIMSFPAPDDFARLMREVGLTAVEYHPLTLGVTYLHVGTKSDDVPAGSVAPASH
jgi:demethylmenaquinone methyltransferase/2-methoxy-6-polyprenyl-1,4-benzoquinol methylase